MKITKELEAEIRAMMDDYWGSYFRGDLEHWQSYLVDDYRNIGGTEEEIWNSKQEIVEYTHRVIDQMAGLTELRNMQRQIIPYDGYLMVHEFMDIFIRIEDKWTFYGKFRLSSLIQKIADTWKVLHQHGSYPDSHTEQGEAFAFDTLRKENTQLREAVKRRTVELENKNYELKIEAAVERVRSASMAMQGSAELASVARTVFEQLKVLEIDVYRSWIDIFHVTEGYVLTWSTDFEGNFQPNPATFPLDFDETMSDFYRDYKSSSKFIELEAHGDEVREWFDYLYSVSSDPIFKMTNVPDDLYQIWAKHKYGTVATTKLSPITNDEKDALNRFAKVFEQAYTRFLDLQKAEAQTREAQIETALERVRSRSMAMQKSDELNDVAFVLFEQLRNLGGEMWGTGFVFCEEDKDEDVAWFAVETGILPPVSIPNTDDPAHTEMYAGWKNNKDFVSITKSGKELEEHYEYMMSLPKVRPFFQQILDSGLTFPKKQQWNTAYYKQGYLLLITTDDYSDPDILKRFAKVFEQSYTRFEDLKKAEAQAREAKIESALERVRARSMGMHKSDDLIDVVREIGKGIHELGIQLHYSQIYTDYTYGPKTDINIWLDVEGQDYLEKFHLPYIDHTITLNFYNALNEGLDYYSDRYSKAEKDSYFKLLFKFSDLKRIPKKRKELILNASGWTRFTVILNEASLNFGRYSLDEFTDEEHEIFIRFAKVFGQAYTRFLDLKKAEEQAREAQIEMALEKVRSRTMAMQSSNELTEAASEMFRQIEGLGLNPWSCGFNIFSDDKTVISQWVSTGDGRGIEPFDTPATEGIFKRIVEQSENDKPLYIEKMEGEKLEDTYKYMASLPTLDKIFEDLDAAGIELPKEQVDHAAFFKHGYLMFITYDEVPEFHSIFKRFAKVFEQTYTRFLDLQKAEEQAREARIETALEKIRSRTMAMQKGEELQEVAVLLYKELIALGVTNFVTCGYVEVNEDIQRQHTWVTAPGGDTMGLFHLPLTGDDTFDARYAAWKKQQTIFHQSVAGQVRSDHLEYAITTFNSKEAEEMVRSQFPDPTVFYCFNFPHGYLHTVGGSRLDKNEELLLARFTKVFAQTYTRFLDLQKAEEQAREAKIEMSLEKIRSRTMGMQSSEELPEVANMLFLEIQELGIPAWSCGYCILTEDRRASTCIMSSEGTFQKPFLLPHHGEASFEEWDDFVHSNKSFFVQELNGDAIESHYGFMKSLPQLKPVFQDLVDEGLSLPTYQVNHLSKFSNGFLLFITYEKVPDAHDIFKRFTSVFDQTYTRFLDLKKSEQRAQEAEVELALERVRSQVTAMQKSSDLFDIVVSMRNEFTSLGHQADYFWHMSWLPESYEMSMTSEDGNRIGMIISIPKHVHAQIPELDAWEKGDEPIFVLALNAEDAWDYIENMNEYGRYEQADPNAPTMENIEEIGGLTFVIARTSHGEIGYSLPGEVPTPPKEAVKTLTRFAGVFDLAYQRFEDLKEAERQARLIREERDRLETALKELHATQDQLIQQEKLASLGQLTAGIAHEIKNPLNFVNNFSDLSVELVKEALDELKLYPSESKEVEDILNDITANLLKVHEHGSRADSIVKSMLEHSRGGSGKMEQTDLNALVKEFVHLTFHGMRANKDAIKVDIVYHLDDNIGNVPIIAEDFSRVIINLTNNAFDAMREKMSTAANLALNNYEPKLTVRTKAENGEVFIEIEDNGSGITKEIKDKILQPFFTTKKGTQGTGLGLSITNDIIKAHGGSLSINTTPEKGSTFSIKILGETHND